MGIHDKPRKVKLSDIQEELKQHLERQELFPVIGSGFARGCRAKSGRGELVPTGKDMLEYMIDYLHRHAQEPPPASSFSKVARYYEQLADRKDIVKYLKDHFIDVELDDRRKSFLKINWKLIYTLNLDDAIEKNSQYQSILPNRDIQLDALTDEKCVFKLHGDAHEYIKYGNDQDKILNLIDYITSLESNNSLLQKLTTDLNFSNAIFIGCSLSDEYDLLSVAQKLKAKAPSQRNRYFVTSQVPDEYTEIDLMDYGIDTVILVDDYDDFYDEFAALAGTCKDAAKEELQEFYNLPCAIAPAKKNTDYLICGKYLLDKSKRTVMFPRFFIEREIEKNILSEMADSPLQIVHGARISGKSYLLASLLRQIHNRDTYYFDSRNHVNAELLRQLLTRKHSVLLFDTNVLTIDTIKDLLHCDFEHLKKEEINIICCINNSDREVLELVGYEKRHRENCTYIRTYELRSRFSYGDAKEEREWEKINRKLKLEDLLPFERSKTILDNLLDMQKKLRIQAPDKFDKPLKIKQDDVEMVCLMILLAQNEKITARELVQCGLSEESVKLRKELKITIEEDHRNLLTLSTYDSASYQIVCNAKVWMLDQLRETGKNAALQQTIVAAFERLVRDFLGETRQFKRVETLVKFDKLNEMFPDGKRLIGDIYKALKSTLNESYQYYHQYAKCHLWGMSNRNYRIEELERARIASLTALSMVDAEIGERQYVALPHRMARAHILNTLTIIYTKLCFMEQFQKPNTIEDTISYFHMAICCSENYSAMSSAKHQRRNVKEEDGGVIKQWVNCIVASNVHIPSGSEENLRRILAYWKSLS